MGRGSQFFWVLNAEKYPSPLEKKHLYSHIDFSLGGKTDKLIKKLRRERNTISKQKGLFDKT